MSMGMELSMGQHQRQELRLAPQLLQKVEILQLTTMELEGRIQAELDENPTLEVVDDAPDAASDGDSEDPREVTDKELAAEFERLDALNDQWNDEAGSSRHTAGEKDKKLEALENTAARGTTLQDHLFDQIHMMDIPLRVEEICHEIVYNIDNNGYLLFGYEDIQDTLPFEVSEAEFEEALGLVQTLDPPGVGARTIEECLLLQLDPANPQYNFLRVLIEHHLEDIKRNKLPQVSRRTGRSIEDIKDALGRLGGLNPRPGAIFSVEETHFVIPDVIVELHAGEYVVRVENQYVPQLRISRQYRKMFEMRGNDAQVRQFIKKKLDSAKLLIESIEQRQVTLYNVASEIVKRQKDFLDHGIKHLRPLKMQEVADACSIHVSTVSRAINKKYMQTPRGIFSMKHFFTGGLATTDGEAESQEAVKQLVKEVIDAEDKSKPLSDDEIMKILKEKHSIEIARRTVSKYRKALNIPSSRQRKEY